MSRVKRVVSLSGPERLCVRCKTPLSSYNTTEECFHHAQEGRSRDRPTFFKITPRFTEREEREKEREEEQRSLMEKMEKVVVPHLIPKSAGVGILIPEVNAEANPPVDPKHLHALLDECRDVDLFATLNARAQHIIKGRFGLLESREKQTLEALGSVYGITRERVRQIINVSLDALRKTTAYVEHAGICTELRRIICVIGGVVSEEELLSVAAAGVSKHNYLTLLLRIENYCEHHKEDDDLVAHWSTDTSLETRLRAVLRALTESLNKESLIEEEELLLKLAMMLTQSDGTHPNKDTLRRFVGLSKRIREGPLGKWGLISSSQITPKNIGDWSNLVLQKHGEPMHFNAIAQMIARESGEPVNTATAHNALIFDNRFVVIGSGNYALAEWGYKHGTVHDVLCDILREHGPLQKEVLIAHVLACRMVKRQTIEVVLYSPTFTKDNSGRYSLTQSP